MSLVNSLQPVEMKSFIQNHSCMEFIDMFQIIFVADFCFSQLYNSETSLRDETSESFISSEVRTKCWSFYGWQPLRPWLEIKCHAQAVPVAVCMLDPQAGVQFGWFV